MKKITLLLIATILVSPSALFSQTTWTDGGADGLWSNAANWTAGVPTTTTAVIFDSGSFPDPDPLTHSIAVENSNNPVIVGSFTAQASTAFPFSLVAAGTETFQVNGALTNLSTNVVDISLDYTFGSNALSGPFSFSSLVNTGTQNVSVAGAVSFTNNVYLTLTNASTFGSYALSSGSMTMTGATVYINSGSPYTGSVGDSFQLFNVSAGTWSAPSLNLASLPTLSTGAWDTTNFATTGSISVVPEPSTWLLLAGGLTTVMVLRRRKRG